MSMRHEAQIQTLIRAVDALAERIEALEAASTPPEKKQPQKAKKTH